jgi:hypothetical protein
MALFYRAFLAEQLQLAMHEIHQSKLRAKCKRGSQDLKSLILGQFLFFASQPVKVLSKNGPTPSI